MTEKENFFLIYEQSANKNALEEIWKAKENESKELNLTGSANSIRDLKPVANLNSLQFIDISSTQVRDLEPLKKLNHLQRVDCSHTKVHNLRPLSNLINLQRIDCKFTKVVDLSPLSNLINLRRIDCYSTKIIDLSSLSNIVSLQWIDCRNTFVSDIASLSNLISLEHFDCRNTQISDLNPLANLNSLQKVYCSNSQVSDLSTLLKLMENGMEIMWKEWGIWDGIYVEGCPLTNPPVEIVKRGHAVTFRYLKEQVRSGAKRLNEARLLVVGQGGAGKTTLKEKIKDIKSMLPAPDATTRGIEIYPYSFKTSEGEDFTLQIWDFGGQNIQHYAHQFFLSDSAVYALLSNEREQNPNFQYWLNIIEMLGKDSPVVIVRNEIGGHCEPLKSAAQIQERFLGIRSIESVDLSKASSDPRFAPLKERLLAEAQLLPHVKKVYPTSFSNIRQKLQILSEKHQVISFAAFKKLCSDEGIENGELMNDYARTFTVLGIALHFVDDVHLRAQVFLRPKWIIDALFQLLYHAKVEKQKGRFSEADALAIWDNTEYDGFHGNLLRLMERFELCYAIEGTKSYIVPQRLPARSEIFENQEATQVQYKYKFMPKGMLTRLTCRLHQRIDGEQVWSDAVQLADKNGAGRTFVREIYDEHTIEINALGAGKEALLNTVIDTLDDIHAVAQFANLKVEKLVPCPCHECIGLRKLGDSPHFFKYDFLLKKLAKGGSQNVDCEKSTEEVRIVEILKHSGVRAFKNDEIENLIAADRVEEALNLLRGQFDDKNEVIQQMSRLSDLGRVQRLGTLAEKEYIVEKNRIRDAVLQMLKRVG